MNVALLVHELAASKVIRIDFVSIFLRSLLSGHLASSIAKQRGNDKVLRPSHSSPGLARGQSARDSPIHDGVGVGRTIDQMADPSYRLAAARSTEHREQELAWQWHVYRLATAKQKIDA
jgi:hypothetical protein